MVNRIRELLDIRQLSPTQFADLIGVGRPVISHILSERNKPSLEVVQKVISAFPDISLAWLMSGTGPMLAGALPVAATPAPLINNTIPGTSTADSTPPAPVLVPPAPASPPLAAPTPVGAMAPVSAPLPAAATILATTQPARLPQPPKFRPAAKVKAISDSGPSAAMAAIASPVIPPASPVAPLLEATLPTAQATTTVSEPVAALAPDMASALPIAPPTMPPVALEMPPVAPAYAESPIMAPAPTTAPASLSARPVEALPPTVPNPAAAFSFLGEAGKTIRRIVLFYNDGSFSDYRPEE